MASSTLKTILGFVRSVFERQPPLKAADSSINGIYNYLQISDHLATSGQPNESQFHLIQQAGYGTVVNLAPTSVLENSLREEAELLDELGMDYVHIPVDFKNPTDADFRRFTYTLENRTEQKVWVHCAANMRVSAFMYRYRTSVLGEDEALANSDLQRIWQPFGVWKAFISHR